MSDVLHVQHLASLPGGSPHLRSGHIPPAGGDRRRPGRIENASPELIVLMRKPSHAARVRVAMYDAPGFLLPQQHRRPPTDRRSLTRMAVAMTACSGLCTIAFHAMFTVWG